MVNKHFCLDQLQSVAIFLEAEHCPFEVPREAPCHTSDEQIQKKSCCSSESEYHKLDQDSVAAEFEFAFSNLIPHLFILPEDYAADVQTYGEVLVPYLKYKPPLVVSDITIELQVFLC